MFRVLFQWRGIQIHSYPAMLYLGLVAGVIAGTYSSSLYGLNSARVYTAMILLIAPALIGSRLLFVAAHWERFRHEPRRIFRRSDGGAMMYGGLLLSLALSVPLLRRLEISFAGFWDMAAITILVGMIPVRIGCLLNGCCSGRPTSGKFGIVAPNENGVWRRRMPSQLLEAALAVVLLIASTFLRARFPYEGMLFLTAAFGYGAGRCWLEANRESTVRIGNLNLQLTIWGALAGFSAMSLLVIWLHRS